MDIVRSDFVTSAVEANGYPEYRGVEFAFVGKSNVGKSSLINSLTMRRKLAKTSKTPGRTQLVNYFIINDEFYFVDLPGYGFAKVPEHIRRNWGKIIEEYLLSEREKVIFLLLDIRRVPSQDDLNLIEWFDYYNIEYYIIFTKSDKFSNNQRAKQLKEIKKKIELKDRKYFFYSSLKNEGKSELLEFLGTKIKEG